jgi:hypothetical protein
VKANGGKGQTLAQPGRRSKVPGPGSILLPAGEYFTA